MSTNFGGDLSNVANLTKLKVFNCNTTAVEGNIEYLANATNLTYLGMEKGYLRCPRSIWGQVFPTRNRTTGAFFCHSKTRFLDLYACNGIDGNINTIFANGYRVTFIYLPYIQYYEYNGSYGDASEKTTTNVSGDISVFADKYNMGYLSLWNHSNITGQVKSLKNLKKLYFCDMIHTSCTGSKSDLYNGGTNVTSFYI